MDPVPAPVSSSPARAGDAASASWPESLQKAVMEFVLQWAERRQGSAAELIAALEEEVGWPARHVLSGALH